MVGVPVAVLLFVGTFVSPAGGVTARAARRRWRSRSLRVASSTSGSRPRTSAATACSSGSAARRWVDTGSSRPSSRLVVAIAAAQVVGLVRVAASPSVAGRAGRLRPGRGGHEAVRCRGVRGPRSGHRRHGAAGGALVVANVMFLLALGLGGTLVPSATCRGRRHGRAVAPRSVRWRRRSPLRLGPAGTSGPRSPSSRHGRRASDWHARTFRWD